MLRPELKDCEFAIEHLRKDRDLLELAGQHLKNTIMTLLIFQTYRFMDKELDKDFFEFRDMLCKSVAMLRKYRIEYFDKMALGQDSSKLSIEEYNPDADVAEIRNHLSHGEPQSYLLEYYNLNFQGRY